MKTAVLYEAVWPNSRTLRPFGQISYIKTIKKYFSSMDQEFLLNNLFIFFIIIKILLNNNVNVDNVAVFNSLSSFKRCFRQNMINFYLLLNDCKMCACTTQFVGLLFKTQYPV